MIKKIRRFCLRFVSRCRNLDREWYFVKMKENRRFGLKRNLMYEMRIYWFLELYIIGIGYGRDCVDCDYD